MSRLAVLAMFVGAMLPSFAQFETSEVLGTVRDASQNPVAKAVVTLSNQDTGISVKTTTGDDGEYDFFNVKVGRYTVTAELAGFSKFSSHDIRVEVNARQRVDAALQVGSVTDTIVVSEQASVVETDTSEHSQVIGTQATMELPLNGRDYASLALLATNVHVSPIQATYGPTGTPREGAFNANGMRSVYNNFLMDGIDNNAYGTSNQNYSSQVVQPSPDALAEFRVTSNFSAEYGRVGGGVVNAALRSGTNLFHGTVYEFLRNTDLNAIGYVFGARSPSFVQPTFHRNQFGATIGGPIIKDKLFFFGDYEGYRQAQGYLEFLLRAGYERSPGDPAGCGRRPADWRPVPGRDENPGQSIEPVRCRGASACRRLSIAAARTILLQPSPITDKSDKYDAKLDYQIKSGMTAFIRFSQRKDISFFGPADPGASGGDGNGFIHAIQQQAGAGYTWAVTPSSLLEARFGFDHVLGGKAPPYLGGPNIAAEYGIEGEPAALAGGFPTQIVTGFSNPTLGRQATNPQFQNPTSFNPKLNYSKVSGRHSIKAGYEFLALRTEVLDINPLYGSDTYNNQYSKPTCAALGAAAGCAIASDATSYDLADFYFGLPSTIAQGSNLVTNLRQDIHSLYVQDDWRVTPKLTVNIGLRWDFATPVWERDNLWSNFNPATNTLVRATPGSLYNRALVNPNYHDFGPRLGMAYSLDAKTVIRAGYGISYNFFNRPGSAEEGINGPLAVFGSFANSVLPGQPGFLTTQTGFAAGIASTFNPINSNNDYIPAHSPWPYTQSWVFSIQREITKSTLAEVAYNGNHSLNLPIIANYNQANPNALTATCNATVTSGCLAEQARVPDPSFGAITWVDPAGDNDYNGLSIRFEHRFAKGLYFLNSFTWGKAMGDSEQALEYYSNLTGANPQNIHDLAAERAPTSYSAKFVNVTSVVYQLPFGRGRQFGSKVNPIVDGVLGGWELTTINTASTGLPINVYYTPSAANDVSGGANAEYRGEMFQRPNVTGSAASQSRAQSLLTYFGGYTFSTPPPNAPFGGSGPQRVSRAWHRAVGLGRR